MPEFQGKRLISRLASSNAAIFFLIILVVLLSRSVLGVYQKKVLTESKKDEIVNKLEELEKRKTNLDFQIAKLKTDRGVEEELRQKFNIVKQGEKLIVINNEIKQGKGKDTVSSGGIRFLDYIKSFFTNNK